MHNRRGSYKILKSVVTFLVPVVKLCVIVLAGGLGRRVNYQYKPLIQLDARPLIEHILDAVLGLDLPVYIFVKNLEQASTLRENVPVITTSTKIQVLLDYFKPYHPLSPVLSAYVYLSRRYSHLLVLPCDLPNIETRLLVELIEKVDKHVDIVIPGWQNGNVEPLVAIYSMRVLEKMCNMVVKGSVSLDSVPVRALLNLADNIVYISAEKYRHVFEHNVNVLERSS